MTNEKLLLHCCCAPCSVSCVKNLRAEGIEPHLFWYNPNIHPYTEYISRLDCLKKFASDENLELTADDNYILSFFLENVNDNSVQFGSFGDKTNHNSSSFGSFGDKNKRCKTCYRMRLEKTASFAAQEGFDSFSTTLLISPYQDHEEIKRICCEMAEKHKVDFFYRDFRPLFREGQSEARAKNYYMQKYCGCIFSEEERFSKGQGTRDRGQGNDVSNQTLEQHDTSSDSNTANCSLITAHCSLITANSSFENPSTQSLFSRLTLLIGETGLKKLSQTRVIIFGLGGVGSWCAEALVRSGIGRLDIVDFDKVCESNINRQLQATVKTIGLSKAAVLKERLLEMNPECKISAHEMEFRLETASSFNIEKAGFIIDAIDTFPHKLDLIETACKQDKTLFSSMGMAFKMDPLHIKTASIWKTSTCPLARKVREGLRKRCFTGDFTVVYSDEQTINPGHYENDFIEKSHPFDTPLPAPNTPLPAKKGSIVTVTAAAGLTLASLVIKEVLK